MTTEPEHWRNTWRTPTEVFFHAITVARKRWCKGLNTCVDLFADEENALADTWFSREDDALVQQWDDPDAWYFGNPPFVLLNRTVPYATEQVIRHKAHVILLFGIRDMQTRYIRDNHRQWDKFIFYPRLSYINPVTKKPNSNPEFPSTMWVSRTRVQPTNTLQFYYTPLPRPLCQGKSQTNRSK